MDKRRVVITGVGAVTPVGNTAEEFWQALMEGRSGIGPITRFDTTGFDTRIAAALKTDKVEATRFGVLVGSGIGGLETLLENYEALRTKGPDRVSPFLIPMLIVNMASGAISMRLGAKGPNTAVVTACATGNHAIGDATKIIQRGDADVMIAGGAEAIIIPLAIAG